MSNMNGYRSSHPRCSLKRLFLKILQNLLESTCAKVFFLIIKKETLAQVFPREFCEIFRYLFFTEHLRATASSYRQSS